MGLGLWPRDHALFLGLMNIYYFHLSSRMLIVVCWCDLLLVPCFPVHELEWVCVFVCVPGEPPAFEPATPGINPSPVADLPIKEPYLREQWSGSWCGIVTLGTQLVVERIWLWFLLSLVEWFKCFCWLVDRTVLSVASFVSRSNA